MAQGFRLLSKPPILRQPDLQLDGKQVTDYLKKKGFTKTEAVFRQERANLGPDGRPAQRNDDTSPKKYLRAFVLLRDWIENNLDIYKVSPKLVDETARLLTAP